MSRFKNSKFNPESLQIEEVPFVFKDYVLWSLRKVGSILIVGTASILLFDYAFDSPKDRAMEREISFLEREISGLEGDLDEVVDVLKIITADATQKIIVPYIPKR